MKSYALVLTLVCTSIYLFSTNPVPVASKLQQVTIFKTGAQLIRTAQVRTPAGKSDLVFKDLSPVIREKTIQVRADAGLTILSVAYHINYLEETAKQEEIVRIEKDLEMQDDQIARLRNEWNVYKQEETLLSKNLVQVVGVSNNSIRTQDLKDLADFERTRLLEVTNKLYELDQQIKKLEKQADNLRKQLAALHGKQTNPSGEITVTVNAAQAQNASFSLTYYIENAGWAPVYDLRVKDTNSSVTLFQKANLYQQSGEAWNDVKMKLSTGDPNENNVRPVLNPWLLRYVSPYAHAQKQSIKGHYRVTGKGNSGEIAGKVVGSDGELLIGASVIIYGTNQGTRCDINGNFVLKVPPGSHHLVVTYIGYETLDIPAVQNGQVVEMTLEAGLQLNEVVVTGYSGKQEKKKDEDEAPPVAIVQLPTTLLYEIDSPVTLSGDGSPQRVDIKTYDLPSNYHYFCTPKLDPTAYLTAQVTGWEALGLLSGEANLFFEGTYMGKSYLEFANTKDTLEISLGRDENISVTRTRLKEFSSRQFLSNKKEDTRSFEIAVKNKKNQPLLITIEDQYPVSTLKDISIDLAEPGNATVDKTTGKLTWDLQLKQAENKKIRFTYKVKYPKEKTIVLE
jgi:hypothetical protein